MDASGTSGVGTTSQKKCSAFVLHNRRAGRVIGPLKQSDDYLTDFFSLLFIFYDHWNFFFALTLILVFEDSPPRLGIPGCLSQEDFLSTTKVRIQSSKMLAIPPQKLYSFFCRLKVWTDQKSAQFGTINDTPFPRPIISHREGVLKRTYTTKV